MTSKHNIAVELAKRILQEKLAVLESTQTVGNSHDYEIEYVARIQNHQDYGYWQFLVKTWEEQSEEEPETKILSFAELESLISRVTNLSLLSSTTMDYVKNIPTVTLNEAKEDSENNYSSDVN